MNILKPKFLFNKMFGKLGYIPKGAVAGTTWHPLIDRSFYTTSGITINAKTALTISAVWACVRIISETMGSLPIILYEQTKNGDRERALNHPLYPILKNSPNQWQTAMEFWEMMGGHLALRGNAFAKIERGFGSITKSLTPLHPDRIVIQRLKSGALRYDYTTPDGMVVKIPQGQMFHLKGLSEDGIVGISPITANRDTLGLAKAAERYGAKFFGDKGSVGSVLSHPEVIGPEAVDTLRDSIKKQNEKGVLILEEGMKWQQLGIAPEEAQFLGTRNFQVVDIARIYRMPPHMIQELSKSSFNNIEQQGVEFVQYTMTPYFTRVQQRIEKDLLFNDPIYFVEYLVNALLRGAIKDRFNAYAKAIQWGWMNRNEIRRLENLNQAERLDDYLYPANLAIVGQPIPTAEPGGFGARPLGVLVKDVATRIANAEQRAFARHGNQGGGWCTAYIAKHQAYIAKILHPIYEAYEEASEEKLEHDWVAETIIECLAWGDSNRVGTITKIINTSFILEVTENVKAK
jgi:HK97 family phage portal protein